MKVKAGYAKTDVKKRYISELIGEEYKNWSGKKILITAPTGTGKSTFIIGTLLPYLQGRRKKLLILCNRRLLRMQYWHDLIIKFERYDELESSIELMTYQQLAENAENKSSVEKLFYDYSVIVCDECHYFYADSDFNAFGTYALLQIIIKAGITKEMIFMSATMDKVRPIIVQTIENCWEKIRRKGNCAWTDDRINMKICYYDYSGFADYSKFSCYATPDIESLCGVLAESSQKSIVFIDSKEKGRDMYERLMKIGKIESQDICVLNAENLDAENHSEMIQYLAISHKMIPKILITTSVMDNGLSVHDPEVGNIAIVTESMVSFLQMLGRIRTEKINQCNLYFLIRDEKTFCHRMNCLKKVLDGFTELEKLNLDENRKRFFYTVWERENVEMADLYRKALVLMKRDNHFFTLPSTFACGVYGDTGIYINEFAKRKIGNLYIAESRFYSFAMNNPIDVIYEQMSWIGKEPDELCVLDSTYQEKRKLEFINYLCSVQNFTQEEMQEFKRKLVKEYRKDFFPDISSNNGTLSPEKIKSICEKYGLRYTVREESKNRKKVYSINKLDVESGIN